MGDKDFWVVKIGWNVGVIMCFLVEIGKLSKCKLDIGRVEVTEQVWKIDNRLSLLDGR